MILFIEDDAITQFIYQDWFSDNDKFLFVETLQEAKNAIENNSLSAIVSDIHLPDGLIYELSELFDALDVPVALAFGSNLVKEEKEKLEKFNYSVRFKKPLEKSLLENWFNEVGVL